MLNVLHGSLASWSLPDIILSFLSSSVSKALQVALK